MPRIEIGPIEIKIHGGPDHEISLMVTYAELKELYNKLKELFGESAVTANCPWWWQPGVPYQPAIQKPPYEITWQIGTTTGNTVKIGKE
jgi:hypothetical protein